MKKILFVYNQASDMNIGDIEAIQSILDEYPEEFTYNTVRFQHMFKKYDELDLKNVDYMIVKPSINAMFSSGGRSYDMSEMMVKDFKGKVFILACDTAMKLNQRVFRDDENGEKEYHNFWADMDVTFLGSFSKRILEDKEAMAHITKMFELDNFPNADFLPLEWLFLHYQNFEKYKNKFPGVAEEPINQFYYGVDKKEVRKSLADMGFGEQEDDAVFGKINGRFPGAWNLTPSTKPKDTQAFQPYARAAKVLMFPYDGYKSKYQFTLRQLEYLALLSPGSTIKVDDRVSNYVKSFFLLSYIEEKYYEVKQEFLDLLR